MPRAWMRWRSTTSRREGAHHAVRPSVCCSDGCAKVGAGLEAHPTQRAATSDIAVRNSILVLLPPLVAGNARPSTSRTANSPKDCEPTRGAHGASGAPVGRRHRQYHSLSAVARPSSGVVGDARRGGCRSPGQDVCQLERPDHILQLCRSRPRDDAEQNSAHGEGVCEGSIRGGLERCRQHVQSGY
eukprot:scaffold2201_cov110-Isochrysis_galbana.AAC.10